MNTLSKSRRIAIVEDDPDLLQSMLEYLHACGYAAWGVSNGDAFYKRLSIDKVDVAIIDIGLPGEDGFCITRYLRDHSDITVLIVSARDALQDRLNGLEAGADRYLVKPINLAELIANIEAIGRRKAPLAQSPDSLPTAEPAASAVWRLNSQGWTLTSPAGAVLSLTDREYRLLQLLISNPGQTVNKHDLAEQIIGKRMPNRNERLDVMVARLRKKAKTALNEELPVKTAYQLGYAFTAPALIQ